MNGYSEIR